MKLIFLYLMASGYIAAGILHFLYPVPYKKIMPPWLPNHYLLIYLGGACEIIFGALLIPETTRPIGAWLIIVMLIAIFPANIQMTINFWGRFNLWFWLSVARLPLRALLIWWAWMYTK